MVDKRKIHVLSNFDSWSLSGDKSCLLDGCLLSEMVLFVVKSGHLPAK